VGGQEKQAVQVNLKQGSNYKEVQTIGNIALIRI